MKYVLLALGFFVLGAGSVVLLAEGHAFRQVKDRASAFENSDGFAAEIQLQDLISALGSGDPQQVRDGLAGALTVDPFDPVLLTFKAVELAPENLAASADLLDQAQAIAPRDPRVRALRLGLQARLQSLPSSALQPAE